MDAEEAAYSAELMKRRGAGPPATLGEVWDANWKASGLDTLIGSGRPMEQAYSYLIDQASAALGPLPQAARDRGLDFSGGMDARAQVISRMIGTLPDEQRKALEPFVDFRSRAANAAAKTEADAADVAGRTYGLSGTATAWTASIARQVVDPVNLAALPAGAGGGSLLVQLGRQAITAAGIQALQEPAIQQHRAELGLEAGFGRAAGEVAMVAGGAVALPLLFRAAAWGLRKAFPRAAGELSAPVTETAPGAETRIPESGPQLVVPAPHNEPAFHAAAPGDMEAAAMLAGRDRVVPNEGGQVDHAAARIERGEPIPAWHASPHDFDAFGPLDAHAGTGEGAATYGHGYYFSEGQGAHQEYLRTLDRAPKTQPERYLLDARQVAPDNPEAWLRRRAETLSAARGEQTAARDYAAAADLAAAGHEPPVGTTSYQVRIHADRERLLDWDKPLNQQAPEVVAGVKRAMGIDHEGNFDQAKSDRLWEQFQNAAAGDAVKRGFIAADEKTVSARLREAGIPGIKYLDEGSRRMSDAQIRAEIDFIENRRWTSAAEAMRPSVARQRIAELQDMLGAPETQNFVIFHHGDVEITHRNAVPLRPEPPAEPHPLVAAARRNVARAEEEAAAAAAQRPLGNPQLAADAERALAAAGEDFHIELGEGAEARKVSARQAIAEAQEDAAAARELEACIGGTVEEVA